VDVQAAGRAHAALRTKPVDAFEIKWLAVGVQAAVLGHKVDVVQARGAVARHGQVGEPRRWLRILSVVTGSTWIGRQ